MATSKGANNKSLRFERKDRVIPQKLALKVFLLTILVKSIACNADWSTKEDGDWSTKEESGLTIEQQQDILELHHELRGKECASNMMFMRWIGDRAKSAYQHAKKCNFIHDQEDLSWPGDAEAYERDFGQPPPTVPPHPLGLTKRRDLSGENIAASSDGDFTRIIKDLWYSDEKKLFCFGNLTRNSVKKSGNYTTMVYHNAQQIGCGLAKCKPLTGFPGKEEMWFFVCRYVYQQLDQEPPFRKGKSCSECGSDEFKCCSGLCNPKRANCPKGTKEGEPGECNVESEEQNAETCANEDEDNDGAGNNEKEEGSGAQGLTGTRRFLLVLPLAALAITLLMI